MSIYLIINCVIYYMFRPPTAAIFREILKLITLLLADKENTRGMNHIKKNKNVTVSVNMDPPAHTLTVSVNMGPPAYTLTVSVNMDPPAHTLTVSVNMDPPAHALTVKYHLLHFRMLTSVDTSFKFQEQWLGAFLQ